MKKKFAPKAGARPARGLRDAPPRKSFSRDGGPRKPYEAAARPRRAPAEGYQDPYQRAARPSRPARPYAARDEGERFAGRSGGFTVSLDPDVARVFRGDASVNKALRLVLQLMQVVEGPAPRAARPAPRRPGYQGSDEARGFSRKPRFVEQEEDIEGED